MLAQAALVALCPIDRCTVFDPTGLPWAVTVVYAEQAAMNLPVLYTALLTSHAAPHDPVRVGVLVSTIVLRKDAPELTALAELARWLSAPAPRSPAIIVEA